MKQSYIQKHLGVSQEQWTINKLKEDGHVSRNQALGLFFSRLGAVIHSLKEKGYNIQTTYKGEDCTYTLIDTSKRQIEIRDNDSLPPIKVNGRWIPQTIIRKELVRTSN